MQRLVVQQIALDASTAALLRSSRTRLCYLISGRSQVSRDTHWACIYPYSVETFGRVASTMAPSSTTLLSGASLGLSACIIMQTMSRAWRTRQSTEREVSSKFVSEILPRMEIFREYEKHCAAKGLHYTDAFKRPSHAQDDMDRRAEEAMNTVSSFWEMVRRSLTRFAPE